MTQRFLSLRNIAMVLTLLDSGVRASEFINATVQSITCYSGSYRAFTPWRRILPEVVTTAGKMDLSPRQQATT